MVDFTKSWDFSHLKILVSASHGRFSFIFSLCFCDALGFLGYRLPRHGSLFLFVCSTFLSLLS